MYKKLYLYLCDECKKKRQSLNPDVAKNKVCSKCKRTRVPESQMSIFQALESKAIELKALEAVDNSVEKVNNYKIYEGGHIQVSGNQVS